MISIAYQANIGCYFFSYLLARWLASIRADVINLPQHPLLHLQNTNNVRRPFLSEETWTGWWPMNSVTRLPLSPHQIRTNKQEFLPLNGYFERTDIVPLNYWDTFLPLVANSFHSLKATSERYDFIAFIKYIYLPVGIPNSSETLQRAVSYTSRAMVHYTKIYGNNAAIAILNCPPADRASISSSFPGDVELLFPDSTYQVVNLLRSSKATLIPECSSLWWIAILSPNLQYLHIKLDEARQTRKKLLRYCPRYGMELMLNYESAHIQIPRISKCSLKP